MTKGRAALPCRSDSGTERHGSEIRFFSFRLKRKSEISTRRGSAHRSLSEFGSNYRWRIGTIALHAQNSDIVLLAKSLSGIISASALCPFWIFTRNLYQA
jgi:hypothetical protein